MGTIFAVLATIPFLIPGVYAQERGEGVGALASRPTGETVEISAGRTAPWAEVIVENEGGELQAVAELDSKGLINFSFLTDSFNLNAIYIYAVDEAGNTNKVLINGTNLNNFILPPTIVGEDDDSLPDNSLKVSGYTFPNAEVSLQITSDEGFNETYTTQAGESDGDWELIVDELPAGSFIAKARSSSEGLTSQESQEVTFEIEDEEGIGGFLPTERAEEIYKNVSEGIKNLPEPIKTTSNVVSKVGVPTASTWALLQVITSGLGLKDLFTYLSLFYFWVVGFFKRRKREEWGVVYDAITKNPLRSSIVRLYSDNNELVETDVTGEFGNFSFLPEPGTYRLEVTKPGYIFPTRTQKGEVDGEYTNLYRGKMFNVDEKNPVVDLSIPVDPKAYGEVKDLRLKLRLFLNKYSQRLAMVFFAIGLLFSFVAYINNPAPVNRVIIIFYLVSLIGYSVVAFRKKRLWGVVVDEEGNPVSDISLSLLDTLLGRQLQRRVTDPSGRYQFVAPQGAYRIVVTSDDYKISPRRGAYQGDAVRVGESRGIVRPKIVVKKV